MRTLRYSQVDAFTSELFKGNPAGVCILEDDWLPDDVMQRIAFENNQAETAFVLPQGGRNFGLRWFTPTVEIDLCGHATLASAYVIYTNDWQSAGDRMYFHSKSGLLTVTIKERLFELDFPSRPATNTEAPQQLLQAIGTKPSQVLRARDWMFVYDSEDQIRTIKPDFAVMADANVIVTAPGQQSDFVSRFFAPGFGVPEDPVTGSTHCTLIPYWADRLHKQKLHARQISARTGELFCELRKDRVAIAGSAVLYSSGTIFLWES